MSRNSKESLEFINFYLCFLARYFRSWKRNALADGHILCGILGAQGCAVLHSVTHSDKIQLENFFLISIGSITRSSETIVFNLRWF